MRSELCLFGAMSLLLSGCGGSDGKPASAAGDSSGPVLEVTSIRTLAATAIPKSDGNDVATQATSCAANAATSFPVSGGRIWIRQAYAILDEVEFNREPSSTVSPEFGPFALDLTNTDPDVGEGIAVDVPAGDYNRVKYRIKRIEDDVAQPIKNVSNAAALRAELIGDPKRRPSVWIEGAIGVGSDGDGYSVCKNFIFVADHRWEVRIPLQHAVSDVISIDTVLYFDLDAAFNMGMAVSNATAQTLADEVGAASNDNMGANYLDGRTKDNDHGTAIATAITGALPANVEVYAQAVTASRTFDDNPSASDQVDSTAAPGTTVIDDSAVRVTGDDNPSVSDLAE